MSELPPANWYPDPDDPNQQRYWDGAQWTEHRAPAAAPSEPAGSSAPFTSSGAAAAGPAAAPAWGDGSSGTTPAWNQGSGATGTGTSGMAIASLVVAVLSFFLAFLAVGGLGGIVAVVLGVMALRRVKASGQGGRGLAIGGIVVGALSILLGIVMLIVFVFLGNAIESGGGGFMEFMECLDQEAQTGQDMDCRL